MDRFYSLLGVLVDKVIVNDEILRNEMKKYVSESFWKKTVYISYGVEEPKEIKWDKKFIQLALG